MNLVGLLGIEPTSHGSITATLRSDQAMRITN